MSKKSKKNKKTYKIQASTHVETGPDLSGAAKRLSISGSQNQYTTYEEQISESYRKYNNQADFGGPQTRVIVDLRTAFISGEGISISSEDDNFMDWSDKFLQYNRLDGLEFIRSVKSTELTGHTVLVFRSDVWMDGTPYIKVTRIPYVFDDDYNSNTIEQEYFRPAFGGLFGVELTGLEVKDGDGHFMPYLAPFVYVQTGGDDRPTRKPTTKLGSVLTDVENYDRTLKDMRRNNYVMARITPAFKTESPEDTAKVSKDLSLSKWAIGKAFVGQAEFDYKTPETGAHQNLSAELAATVKSISTVTGVPVHWLGFVEMMSNRNTAETLYDLIKNNTIIERSVWEHAFHELLIKAQTMYIDNGGTEISSVNYDFKVTLPLVDFEGFGEIVSALSTAYADRAISMQDYRANLPGIDSVRTKKFLEAEQDDEILHPPTPVQENADDDNDDDGNVIPMNE